MPFYNLINYDQSCMCISYIIILKLQSSQHYITEAPDLAVN